MVLKSTIKGLDAIEEKVTRLQEIIKEANSLAEELASHEVTISSEVVK